MRLFFWENKGFTILEVIIAGFVLVIGVVGVAGLVVRSTSTTVSIENQITAWYLAQEGIEIVRNIRDTNFLMSGVGVVWDAQGLDSCTNGCGADYNDSLVSPALATIKLWRDDTLGWQYDGFGNETIFQRKFTITKPNDDKQMEVRVEVSWTEKGNTQTVELVTELYDLLFAP